MKIAADLLEIDLPPVPKVPAWARSRGEISYDVDGAYMAGAALNSLDSLVRQSCPWAGAWRQRLALHSASAAVNLTGRREDESALRDTHFLRGKGDDPGPAGHLLMAWRRLASRTTSCDAELVRPVVEQHFALQWDDVLAEVVANAEDLTASSRPAPALAAEIAAAVYRARPDAELLAFWLADMVLAQKFRWPVPVPLLMGQVASPTFKSGEHRKRIRPGGEGWGKAVFWAYATAAAEACDLGSELGQRAAILASAAPKLRAKGAGDVIKLLLSDDAVPGSWSSPRLSARGARRLFDRLGELGGVRELSGRPTFRLYGL
ncbi:MULTISPECIES: DUF1403 family protein [unclassified Shinella]|uniref:DUF1403 family protein n=1 Tax=unclassified Shinella TaxID=2643062 RepID=UPI00225C9F0E|nr:MULTISPECIES: DUF1403 family protein [unclassified Shinella]CAI0334063.1 conserved hypothetical protein [Rhizobiaceae bacterium]CAK7261711.1 DUF1403 family protein [Shinella sp. WSC3-e]MDC7259769.1 DUF1403 family protein [Shinella sp. YE25]MDC7260372.1 DUF1403 family protein [Shinella sp. YE25]MDC7267060.1 DUF1403 family protein [Shinella sp. HY16]